MKYFSSKALSSPLLKTVFILLIILNLILVYFLLFGTKVIIDDRQSTYSLSYKVSKNTPDLFSSLLANSDDFSKVSKIRVVLFDQSIPDIQILTYTYPVPFKTSFGNKTIKPLKEIVLRVAIDPKNVGKMSKKNINDEFLRSVVQFLYTRINPGVTPEKKVEEVNKITEKYSQNNPFDLVKK